MEDSRNDDVAGYIEEKVKIKRAISWTKISWEEVEAKTIKSCFAKTSLFDDFRFDILRNVFHENLEVKHDRDVLIELIDNVEGFDKMNPSEFIFLKDSIEPHSLISDSMVMQECRNANIENTFENSYKLDVFVQKVKELEKIRKKSELYNAIIDESLEKIFIEC